MSHMQNTRNQDPKQPISKTATGFYKQPVKYMNLTFNLGADSRVTEALTVKRVKSPMQVMKQKKFSIANDPLNRTLLFNNTYLLKSMAWMNSKTAPIHRNRTVNVKTLR